MRLFVSIGIGGLTGTLARYVFQGWIQSRAGTFPLGTLAINIAGSLVLGFVIRYATASTVISPELRAGLTDRVLRCVHHHEHVQLRKHSTAGRRAVLARRAVHGRDRVRVSGGGNRGNRAGGETTMTETDD